MLLVAAAVAATREVLGGRGGSAGLLRAPSRSVVLISPGDGQLRGSFPVGANPSSLAIGGGAVWAANADDQTITRIDLASHTEHTYGTDGTPLDLAADDGTLWVVNGARTSDAVVQSPQIPYDPPESVSRLDPETALTLATVRLAPGSAPTPPPLYDIALGRGNVWVINPDTSVARIDPVRDRIVQTIRNLKPLGITRGAEGTWVIQGGANAAGVARLSPRSDHVVQRVQVPARSLSGSIARSGRERYGSPTRSQAGCGGSTPPQHRSNETSRSRPA